MVTLLRPHVSVPSKVMSEILFILNGTVVVSNIKFVFGPDNQTLITYARRFGYAIVRSTVSSFHLLCSKYTHSRLRSSVMRLWSRGEEDYVRDLIFNLVRQATDSVVVLGDRGIERRRYSSSFQNYISYGQLDRDWET